MFEDIKNKSALVTGSSRGIGNAISVGLLEKGARVYGVSRSEDKIQPTKNLMNSNSSYEKKGEFINLSANLLEEKNIEKITSRVDKIDILIHNAAYFLPKPFDKLTKEDWERHIYLNLTIPFLLTQALWGKLKKSSEEESSVIFISSLAGVQNKEKFSGTAAYVSSKMGLVGLSEVIAKEGKEFNIRSNSISPASVDTDMLRSAFPTMKADFSPQEIARTVLYYASSVSSPITGTNVIIER